LGEGLGAMGKYQESIDQLNAALKIDPKHTGAYLDLGMVARLTNNNSAAEGYYQKVLSLTEGQQYSNVDNVREQAMFDLGQLLLDEKRWAEAAGYLKGALQIRSDASDTYYSLAQAYQGLGDIDAAIEQLKIALQFDPGFAEAHYFLGQLYQQQKDDLNATGEFAQAVKLAPGADPPAQALDSYGPVTDWITKAKTALSRGDIEAALTDIKIARNIDAKSFDAAVLHGEILVARGDLKDALDVYRQAAALNSKDAAVQAQIVALEKQVKSLTPAKAVSVKRAATRKAAAKQKAAGASRAATSNTSGK